MRALAAFAPLNWRGGANEFGVRARRNSQPLHGGTMKPRYLTAEARETRVADRIPSNPKTYLPDRQVPP